MKNALFITIGIFTVSYLVIWLSAIIRGDGHRRHAPGLLDAGIGFFANFLDTLGIGSFATTSSLFKLGKLVPDEQIPGTMNVGHTLPTVTEAFIYVGLVQVDPTTLISLIAASAVGAWLGAGVVSHWPRRKVQIGMGSVLVLAACLMLMSVFHWGPGGGNAMGLTGPKLVAGILGNALLGALMTLGIGSLRALHDSRLYAGNESAGGFPHHDGIVRVPDAGGQHAIHSHGELQSEIGFRAGHRRNPRRADCRVHCEVTAARCGEVAGNRGGALYVLHDAAVGS